MDLEEGYSSSLYDSADASGYGCQRCLRNGWIYATTQFDAILESGVEYIGECCEAWDETSGPTCITAWDATVADTNLASGWSLSSDYNNVDEALGHCPMKVDKCIQISNGQTAAPWNAVNWRENPIGFSGEWTT